MTKITKIPLVTKYNKVPVIVINKDGNRLKYLYEFTMYRTFTLYPVAPFRFRGEMKTGHAEIEVYGLIVRKVWFEGAERKEKETDLGPLSAQQYEVNSLLQLLCRSTIPSVDLRIIEPDDTCLMPDEFVFSIYHDQAALWNRNDWGNPFGRAAENVLKEKLKAELDDSPVLPSLSELKQKRRNPLARLHEMFKQGPNNNGKGIDG